MFENNNYYCRLQEWSDFRQQLETARDPIKDVLQCYSDVPIVSMMVDPYDNKTWPGPWELILENLYCPFSALLGVYYTLKLTERFGYEQFEIHIGTDRSRSQYVYFLTLNGNIIHLGDNVDTPITYETYPLSSFQ